MSKLTNKKAVRDYALLVSESQYNGRTRVGANFLRVIESETQAAVVRRCQHHDNKTGSRKTLV
jgi:hypothetical protein